MTRLAHKSKAVAADAVSVRFDEMHRRARLTSSSETSSADITYGQMMLVSQESVPSKMQREKRTSLNHRRALRLIRTGEYTWCRTINGAKRMNEPEGKR